MENSQNVNNKKQDAGQKTDINVDEQQSGKNQKEKRKFKSPMNPIQLFFLNATIIVIVIWLLFGVVFGFVAAPNGDMTPNVKSGDLLMYYRLDKEIKAQDVVVLYKNGTTYVGRVVAVGGDTVEVTDSESLIINGNTMIETNIYTSTPRYVGYTEYPLTLEKGEYFILVDSRNGGEDSRYYGTVSEDEILGKVITIIRRNNL